MSTSAIEDSREKTLKLLDEPDPDDTIQREFEIYCSNNPHVLKFLVKYALQAVNELRKRGEDDPQYSIAAVVERVRWHVNFEVKGYPDFKLDNNFRSRYARLLMRQVPKLRGVFNIRPIQSQKKNKPSTPETADHAINNLNERNGHDREGNPN